jgi:SNF2 family DNA or RNA helicase
MLNSNYDFMIIDEAHILRNKKLKSYEAVTNLKRLNKSMKILLLTGTPMQNSFTELFDLINLMRPTEELE